MTKRIVAGLLTFLIVAEAAVTPARAAVIRAVVANQAPAQVPVIGALAAPSLGVTPAAAGLTTLSLGSSLVLPGALDVTASPGGLIAPVQAAAAPAARTAPAAAAAPKAAQLASPSSYVQPAVRPADAAVSRPGKALAHPAASPGSAKRTPAAGLRKRIGSLGVRQAADSKEMPSLSGEGARTLSRKGFRRLLGARESGGTPAVSAGTPGARRLGLLARRGADNVGREELSAAVADVKPAALAPTDPQARKRLRYYLTGTGIFKIGMEALGVSVPLLALTVFGQVTWAAVFSVGWVLSQAVFSSMAGGLLDRKSPSKILGWSMTLQASAVAGILGLFAMDAFFPALLGFPLVNPYTILTLYSLAGAFMGVSDTARQVIPAEIVKNDEEGLKLLNAKAHISYEIAGVAGAFLTGAIIATLGLVPALILHPPAYLLAGLVFSRLKLPARNPHKQGDPARGKAPKKNPVGRALHDMADGARAVMSKPVFRWAALALILPLVLHRLLEGLLIPVAAKSFLGNPSAAAWIIGASNFGELIGAIFLARSMRSKKEGPYKHSHFWAKLMAMGLLAVWALAFSPHVGVILPLIALSSLTWAASDLSIRSKLQSAFPKNLRGRAFGFINAAAFLLILGFSLGLGFLMDAIAHQPVFYGVNIGITVLAVLMAWAGHKLKAKKKKAP